MGEFVLTVWAKDDPDNANDLQTKGIPISLWELDEHSNLIDPPIATHATGVEGALDLSAFSQAIGGPFTIESVLTQAGLGNDQLMQHVGHELWKRLALGGVKAKLTGLIGQDCCIYLDLKSPSLERLPWELLNVDGLSQFTLDDSCWIIGNPNRTSAVGAGRPPDAAVPLRILIVIGNDPTDVKLKANEELAKIERHAHDKNADVLLKVLSWPALSDIERVLNEFRPHIFHFIGHGDVRGGEPLIDVWNAREKRNDPLSLGRIREVFRKSPPRLVLLNACSTATTSRPLADAFLYAGCTAVLAVMGEILDNSSLQLSDSLYRCLCAGQPIDKAVAAARHELKNTAYVIPPHSNQQLRSNWPLLRLLVNGKVADVLKISTTGPMLPEKNKPCPDFVDRWNHRWQILQTIDPKLSRLLVLYGTPKSGKTELLRTLVAISAQQGSKVLVVNRAAMPSGTWQDLLGYILEEVAELGYDTTSLRDITINGRTSDKVIPEFLKALESLVQHELLLVIDGVETWPPETLKNYVLPLICKPYLHPDPNSKMRLVISLLDKPDKDIWGVIPNGWCPIEVGEFQDAESESARAIRQMELFWTREIRNKFVDKPEKLANFSSLIKNLPPYMVSTNTLDLIRRFAGFIIQGREANHE